MSKKGSEKAVAVVNMGNKVEYVLCIMDMCFPTSAEFLNDLNVWIADTAACLWCIQCCTGVKV